MTHDLTPRPLDSLRQALVLLASPLIWVFSSLGVFIETARSPREFSDLSTNLLVPQTTAFSIWFPIFIGILAYGIVQASRRNRARAIYRESGWWMVAGLWGIAAWGLVTAYAPDTHVELLASLIFIPALICLVIAMVKIWHQRETLSRPERWLVLAPISVIAGWCSLAVFVGLNGLIWSYVEGLGWNITASALSVLGLALWWIIYVLRQHAMNRLFTLPIIWGLGFLALRHFSLGEGTLIGSAAVVGLIAVLFASNISGKVKPCAQ